MNQENSQVKKTKEQIRMEKKRSASIVMLPKQTKRSLDITGFQPEDNVFILRDSLYMKVYLIENMTEDRRAEFIEKVGQEINLRVRVSSIHKLRGGKYSKLFFLSVFVEAFNYTKAYEHFTRLDAQLLKKKSEFHGVSLIPCSVNYTMMYITMNFSGNLRKYDIWASIRKKENWKETIFPKLEDRGLGYKDESTDRYGICYVGIEYPSKIVDLYQKICDMGIEFKSCVDFQKMNEQDSSMYQKRLEQKYNYQFTEDNKEPLICVTFLFSIAADSYEELLSIKDKLLPAFEEQSLIVSPCPEQQEAAYYSLGSLGMTEYRAMRSAKMNVISRLPV